METKKKSTFSRKYKKGVTIKETFFKEEILNKRTDQEVEILSDDTYDDGTGSVTVKIHYK